MNPPIMPPTFAPTPLAPIKPPGRLAHKWVEDFLARGLGYEPDLQSFNIGCHAQGKPHEFIVKPEQCVTTELRQAGDHYIIIVSAMCTQCRYHFIFRISAPSGRLCTTFHDNFQRPLHHLLAADPISKDLESCSLDNGRDPKYLNCCGHAAFRCSAQDCSFRLSVEVSLPRLPQKLVDSLLDDDAVKARLAKEMEDNPDRFSKQTGKNMATFRLEQYISHTLMRPEDRPSPPPHRIQVRNAIFAVQFGAGEASNYLFNYLEFEKRTDKESGAECWYLPTVENVGRLPSIVPSKQSFFQDVRAELLQIMPEGAKPRPEDPGLSLKTRLRDALHCSEKYCGNIENREAFGRTDQDRADYHLLGLTDRSSWRIFSHAYECQTRTDQNIHHRKFYLEALRRLAAPHSQESLNMLIATEESRLDVLKIEQSSSLVGTHAGPNGGAWDGRTSDLIIGEYRNKVSNSAMSPNKEVAARKCLDLRTDLYKVAMNHPDKSKLMAVVGEPMEPEEALVSLELTPDRAQISTTDATLFQALAQGQIEQGKDAFIIGLAVKTIGEFLNNDTLTAMAGIVMGEPAQDEIQPKEEVNDPNLPAGLDNLRNTCYLNSMLQYFFTINPVRELVLNFDDYKLPDTEESRSTRRVTTEARGISAKQAYVANELANELRTLFSDLKTTQNLYATPTQRLALAAMKDTHQLESRFWELESQTKTQGPQLKGAAQFLEDPPVIEGQDPNGADKTITASAPPDYAAPLPPRGKGSGGATFEHLETSSNVSSQTLVNGNSSGDNGGSADWNPLLHRVDSVRSTGSGASSMQCEVNEDDVMDQQIEGNLGQYTVLGSGKDVDMLDMSAEPEVSISSAAKAAAAQLAQTTDDKDSEEQAISRIRKALDDKTIKGTDQEDVQEAMDKMLHNLRSAIKPTGVESVGPKDEAQTDAITEILRLTRIGYHKPMNKSEWTMHSATTDLFLLAYPARPGSVDLHEALERGFMREISENQQEPNNPFLSFSSIRRFPPILHICIQRTVYDQSARAGKKIDVSIQLPQVLYMDRYQESTPGDELWNRRHRYWDFLEMEDPKTMAARRKLEQKKPSPVGADTTMTDAADDNNELEDYHASISGTAPKEKNQPVTLNADDWPDLLGANGSKPSDAEIVVIDSDPEETQGEARRLKYQDTFDDLREHEYHIHAVICHGGSTGASGHYWVWIYDFEHRVWYKYNDRTVTVHADGDGVLKDLSASDQPYYIAYVRRDKLDLVSIPRRTTEAAAEASPRAQDVEMSPYVEVSP